MKSKRQDQESHWNVCERRWCTQPLQWHEPWEASTAARRCSHFHCVSHFPPNQIKLWFFFIWINQFRVQGLYFPSHVLVRLDWQLESDPASLKLRLWSQKNVAACKTKSLKAGTAPAFLSLSLSVSCCPSVLKSHNMFVGVCLQCKNLRTRKRTARILEGDLPESLGGENPSV